MSYDQSKNFKGNMKAKIKDEFCFSPAVDDMYDYKTGIVKEYHIGGVTNMMEPEEGQYATKMNKREARYEQDEAETNPTYP
jgi:hypothetical protein